MNILWNEEINIIWMNTHTSINLCVDRGLFLGNKEVSIYYCDRFLLSAKSNIGNSKVIEKSYE